MTITTAIIEDDADTRRLFAGWLDRSEGFDYVGEYADAESALAALPLPPPPTSPPEKTKSSNSSPAATSTRKSPTSWTSASPP